MRNAHLYLNPQSLQANFQRVQQLAAHSKILCMVKADAYGHGIGFAISTLKHADAFGVACISEAREIRALGNTKPIVLIEGVDNHEEWIEANTINAQCVIHCANQLAFALQTPLINTTVWLKVNTGMNRLGFTPETAIEVAEQLKKTGYHLILTTHFANADQPNHPMNQQQIEVFLALKAQLNPIAASLCNSAAIFNWPHLHFDWVRPGIMLYGSSPFAEQSAIALGLTPVMQLQSNIIAIHQLAVGDKVGYGSSFTAQQPTKIGVVAIGYGDGYPRVVINAHVGIGHLQAPIVGRVSMDMLTIDLTDIPDALARIGTSIVLWGENPTADTIANCANTISYELFCRLGKRPRRFFANDK